MFVAATILLSGSIFAQTGSGQTFQTNQANRQATVKTNAAADETKRSDIKTTNSATHAENKANIQSAAAGGTVTKSEATAVHQANQANRANAATSNNAVRKSTSQSNSVNRQSTFHTNRANRGL